MSLTCFPGMYPCTVALTTSAPMSTRWIKSRGTMLAPSAGGSSWGPPSSESPPRADEELLRRSPPAAKGYDDDNPSPKTPPTLVDYAHGSKTNECEQNLDLANQLFGGIWDKWRAPDATRVFTLDYREKIDKERRCVDYVQHELGRMNNSELLGRKRTGSTLRVSLVMTQPWRTGRTAVH